MEKTEHWNNFSVLWTHTKAPFSARWVWSLKQEKVWGGLENADDINRWTFKFKPSITDPFEKKQAQIVVV